MKQIRPYPRAVITKKAARALTAGHPWVFAGEVLRLEPAPLNGRAAENGDMVDVVEENGTWQGAGLLSEASTIRIRIITRNANDHFDDAFWSRKLNWAWKRRVTALGNRALPGCESDLTCCRILFSEADGFPGLVVDKYEDILVAQVGTVGMQKLRDRIYPLLLDVLTQDGITIRGIYERNDSPSRAKEGLPLEKGWYDTSNGPNTRIIAHENGIAFDLDLENSQKTGFFLDQKYNRRAVRRLAKDRRVLDCFSHVGPFGLNAAAGGASFVRCVDISQTACNLAQENARLNGLDTCMDFTCANVMKYLPALAADKRYLREQGGPFDLIVLDPPAFTKSRSTVKHAMHGYQEINELAMKLLPRGGYLATCSCSHFMTTELLKKTLHYAARNAGVSLLQLEERQQAPDHPILWGVPETHYLDFFVFQVI